MTYRLKRGWFAEVNGSPVTKSPLSLPTTSFVEGHPTGILWHYTVGCNEDIAPTLRAKQFGATFNVGRSGVIYQYRPLLKPSWHAYDASRHYVGIEHTSKGPGSTCELTDVQLEASARLSAAIIEWVWRKFDFEIPLTKTSGPNLIPGFKNHADGTRETWNPNVHVDGLFKWSWGKYLSRVTTYVFPYTVDARKDERQRERDFRDATDAGTWAWDLVEKGWRVVIRKRD